MRDNHEGMMEVVDAFEKDNHYFAVVELRGKRFRFGVSHQGYLTLKNAMQMRPFDLMPGRRYRYFYAQSYRSLGSENFSMDMRIELDRDATSVTLAVPKELHANLLWFSRLEKMADAEYLEVKE